MTDHIALLERAYRVCERAVTDAGAERVRADILAYLKREACVVGATHYDGDRVVPHPQPWPTCAARAALERIRPAPMDWDRAERVLREAHWRTPDETTSDLRLSFLYPGKGRTRELYDAIMALERP